MAAVRVFPAALTSLKPLALAGKLEDRSVVNEAIDHRRRCHRIGKDVRPIGEREIRTDGNALTFVKRRRKLTHFGREGVV